MGGKGKGGEEGVKGGGGEGRSHTDPYIGGL